MIEAFIQKHWFYFSKFNNFYLIQKVFYSDSAVVGYLPKLKKFELPDRSRNKRVFKKNFIEELFLNKFQAGVLDYPEIDNINDVNSLVKQCSDAKELMNIFSSKSKEATFKNETDKTLWNLKNLELTGFQISTKKGGFGYLNSECAFMQETISSDLNLSNLVMRNETFGIDLIQRIGTDNQKEMYVPKLISCEKMATFAHLEADNLNTLDPILLNTNAELSPDNSNYIVNGKKIWVYNASHADIIIFSANICDAGDSGKSKVGLFLVDKHLTGIKVDEPMQRLSTKGIDCCSVTFDNVTIPKDCILGKCENVENEIKKSFSKFYLSIGAQSVGMIKKLIEISTHHCIYNKIFSKYKYEQEYYKSKLSNLVSCLFAVESMTYLLAGRMDMHENADVFLESLILKIFSTENLQYVLDQTLLIIGSEIYSENNNNIQKLIEDCILLTACNYSNHELKQIISKVGCHYVLNYKKNCNFFQKMTDSLDAQLINYFFGKLFSKSDSITPSFKLNGYLHLMLKNETFLLEDMILMLKVSADSLLKQYGDNIFSRHLELKLLADLVIYIYAGVSILGRASRAYCIGVRNQEVDIKIIRSDMLKIHDDFLKIVYRLKNNAYIKSCDLWNSASDIKKFNKKHPIVAS